jgi:uncharacterized repeat protein (TIGR01451 family)
VSLAVELAPAQPVAGEFVTVSITATNNGPSDATGVRVVSQAPAGATEASGTATKGSCEGTINLVCTIGTLAASPASTVSLRPLAAGESAQVIHRYRLGTEGPAIAEITADTSSSDPNPSDNQRVVSIPLGTRPPQDVEPPEHDGKPNPNETVVVQELTGRVLVKLPDGDRYVDLSSLALEEVPNGTLVDARKGRFALTVAAAGDTTASTVFYDGIAAVTQQAPATPTEPGTTELRLAGGDFGKPCTTALAKAKPKAKKKAKAKRTTFAVEGQKPVKPVRRLWGNGTGNFRTKGRYSTATVRGTQWLTEDYCNGTLVRVQRGTVAVRDLVKNRTVLVPAGKSYFAEAPPAKRAKKKG